MNEKLPACIHASIAAVLNLWSAGICPVVHEQGPFFIFKDINTQTDQFFQLSFSIFSGGPSPRDKI